MVVIVVEVISMVVIEVISMVEVEVISMEIKEDHLGDHRSRFIHLEFYFLFIY